MYVLLAVLTGGLVSLMIEANGVLQILAGVLPALLLVHLSGLAASGIYGGIGVARDRMRSPEPAVEAGGAGTPSNPPGSRERTNSPWWFLAAGILGVGVVFMGNEVYRRGGVVLTLMGTLAGQTLAAQLLEKTRWFEGRSSPPLQRVLALALVLPGTAVIGWWSGAGPVWVLLSWIPGGVLMVQQMMNSRNVLRFGQRTMLLFNYVSALTALGVLVLIQPSLLSGAIERVARIPVVILCGGGVLGVLVTGLGSFLLTRTSALRVVLGSYTGQIAVGILLDVLSSRPFSAANGIGIAMVVAGLLAGETDWLKARASRRALRGKDGGPPGSSLPVK